MAYLKCFICGNGMNEQETMLAVDPPGTDKRRWAHENCMAINCDGLCDECEKPGLCQNRKES